MAIFFPLQGFFNALIYIRPRYLRCRSRNPDKPAHHLFIMALQNECHPARATPNDGPGSQPMETETERHRRSCTASFYSTGNVKRKTSGEEESVVGDDIDTVNARADESDFSSDHSFVLRPISGKKVKLDAVSEANDGVGGSDHDDNKPTVTNLSEDDFVGDKNLVSKCVPRV